MSPHPEIGRELKVSELQPPVVVILWKANRPTTYATLWVRRITPEFVHFGGNDGLTEYHFLAERTGPDREQITDDSGTEMKMFEYLGKV